MVVADPFLANIQHAQQQNSSCHLDYSLVEGHLHYHGRLVIPVESPYVHILLREFHNSAMGGGDMLVSSELIIVWLQNFTERHEENGAGICYGL